MADRLRAARALAALVDPLVAGTHRLLIRLIGRFGWRYVLIGFAVAVYAAARYRTWIWVGVVVFCAAAWMHAPAADERPAEGEPEEEREAPVDPLPGILWELIGEAPGVHLPSIVRHLHETGLDAACDRADVRAALDRRGIPLRDSVREADGRVNKGVHRADLQAWEEALSPAAIEAGPKMRSYPATTPLSSGVAADTTAVATPPTPAETP
jgi:hypothetical protein